MPEKSDHLASCACGALRIAASGEPDVVSICNCTQCQRRTGSAFGVGVYYPRERVRTLAGVYKTFARTIEGGRAVGNRFCPECGTTVYWTIDLRPQHFGIALGTFDDPDFVRPARVVWAQHQFDWVRFAEELPVFPRSAS